MTLLITMKHIPQALTAVIKAAAALKPLFRAPVIAESEFLPAIIIKFAKGMKIINRVREIAGGLLRACQVPGLRV